MRRLDPLAWMLALGTSLGAATGCSLLGTPASEPEGLPHNGVGPFRDLTPQESGLSREGVVVLHRGLLLERPMEGGRHLFYAGAAVRDEMPVDAGVDDAGLADAGVPDAGGDAGTPTEIDWTRSDEGRRIYRSAPRDDDWGFVAGSVVLAPEGGPAWEGGYVTDPWAVETDDGALLYYAADGGIGVARASSIDGTFTRSGDGPALAGAVRCPSVVPTTGTPLEGEVAYLMAYEADGTVRLAGSSDGLVFTDRGEVTIPAIVRRDVRDGEEVEVGCPGMAVATPSTGRRFFRIYYESRRDNGARLIGLVATADGVTFDAHPVPVVQQYDRGMPAPHVIDARLSILLQWTARIERGAVVGELNIGMAPGGSTLTGGTR